MVMLIMFVLSTIGLTNILVHGSIFDFIRNPLRDLLKKINKDYMLDCYECVGFWAGLICGLIFFFQPMWSTVFIVLSCGWAGSLLSQFYQDLMYILRSFVQFEIKENSENERQD